jgi:hypothetical protein
LSPVLFIAFNRPNTTSIVFEAIRKEKPTKLYIALDAPREGNVTDEVKHSEVKKIVDVVDWPCEVHRLYQTKNLGCSLGPRAAFQWFFSLEKEGIILEDDCVPNSSFFSFATEMLERYRDNKKVLSINGSNFGFELNNGDSYFFSRYMNMWGWATWANRANEIDYSLASWKEVKNPLTFLHNKLSGHFLDIDINWYKYWQHKFDLTVSGKNVTWWDWQWIYHQIKNKKMTIVPAQNLVTNIGFNADGTHTLEDTNPAANIPSKQLPSLLIHPRHINFNAVYEEHFVKWIWCYYKRLPLLFYVKRFVSRILKKQV